MSAITPTSTATDTASADPAPAPANLDAEQAKVESQLADWVHCASAKTPEGKAKIEQLSTQLNTIKAKVEKATEVKTEAAKSAHAANFEPKKPSPNSVSTLGHVVDAFA